MRQWLCERVDDALFPVLKLLAPGYRNRLSPYRESKSCDAQVLAEVTPPSAMDVQADRPWRGFRTERYRFDSPLECTCDHNRAVSGRFLHADPGSPWAVIVPGYATGAWPLYGYSVFQDIQGRSLLERGLNVALIDPPFHLSRSKEGCPSGEGFFSPDLAETQFAVLQATSDVIALVRWLRARSGHEVGVWGTSMGGCIAGLAAAHATELGAVVLMEPLDNPGDTLSVIPGTHEIREVLAGHGIAPDDIPAVFRHVAPSSYPPKVAQDRILFVTPIWDRIVPTPFQEAFWTAWQKPARILVESGHVLLGTNRTVSAQAADFMAGWILRPA